MSTRFDIRSDNFDNYFEAALATVDRDQIKKLPGDLADSIYRNKTSRIGFLGKIWTLCKLLRKRIWIVVDDEESGLNINEFFTLRKAIKDRDYGVDMAKSMMASGVFVTGDRELSEAVAYLNRLSASPAYNYLSKIGKKVRANNEAQREHVTNMRQIARAIRNYEASKKLWMSRKDLNMPELLVLIYLYDKDQGGSSRVMYKDYYYNSIYSMTSIRNAIYSLRKKRMIEIHGMKRDKIYILTQEGKDVTSEILSDYILNL